MRDLIAFFGEFIVVIAVSGMLYTLAPEGAQKKYIHFAISLCVLAALIGPMLSVVSSLPEILDEIEIEIENDEIDMETELEDALISASKENIERSIVTLLTQKFELEQDLLSVETTLDASDPQNIKIISVTVSAPGTTHVMRERMKEYLSDELMGHCKIIIQE